MLQIDPESGKSQTYADLLKMSIRIAQHMQARGISSGDVVTLCSRNIMESYATFLAILYLGAYAASLDPTLSGSDVELLLKQVEPRLIFCGTESINLVETALNNIQMKCEIVVYGESKKHLSFSQFITKTGTENSFEAKPADDLFDTVVIFFSSGTTGLPKGICATHYGLLSKFDTKNDASRL